MPTLQTQVAEIHAARLGTDDAFLDQDDIQSALGEEKSCPCADEPATDNDDFRLRRHGSSSAAA
jgi:hypothetical protein